MSVTAFARRLLLVSIVAALGSMAAACASAGGLTQTPPPDQEPDAFLFARGSEALEDSRWLTARE